MQKILIFQGADFNKGIELLQNKNSKIFNFLNLYSVYLFRKEPVFQKSVSQRNVLNFIDGGVPSLFLSIKNMKRVSRLRGPTFTRSFLEADIAKKSRIMFVGSCADKDLNKISTDFNIPRKNLFFYNNLPFIAPKIEFEKRDIKKLSQEIKLNKIQYCFICVGNPRQEILSYELSKIVKSTRFFSVGAALDFILERKKEAPKIIRRLYIEWMYRLITDFKYSKKKVLMSFIGLWYLISGKVKIEVEK